MYEPYQEYLLKLHTIGRFRKLGLICPKNKSDFLDFSTNDYLNLSQKEDIIKAAEISGRTYGVGSTGSRLLSGNLKLYEEFENTIAIDKHTESSLIFNSGFQLNISTLSCLLDHQILNSKPLVFFDKLNHSSLYQAVFLSKAELCRYRHNDMNYLEDLLIKYNKQNNRSKFIVTETIFGMDGDMVQLEQLAELANKYNAFLYLDEAHATGVFGIDGYGLSTTIKLNHIPHVIMGTFSKTIGASGGYIACSKIISDFLINKSTGFIYSTALSPTVIGAAFKAWKLIKTLSKERHNLQQLGNICRKMLIEQGFNIGTSQTHIIPIILKDEKICLKAKQSLLNEGIIVSCVRPPTVPVGSARLRIALTLNHQLKDLEKLIDVLIRTVKL